MVEEAMLKVPAAARPPSNWADLTSFLQAKWRQLRTSNFVHKVAATYITQIVLAAISAAMLILVTRNVGPAQWGEYSFAMWLTALGIQFGNLGLPASNTFQVAKRRHLLPVLFCNSLLVSVVIGGLGATAVGGLLTCFPQWAGIRGNLLHLALIGIPLGLAILLMQNLALGVGAVRVNNMVSLINNGIKISLVISLIGAGLANAGTICAADVIGVVVGGFCAYWALRGQCQITPRFSHPVLTRSLQFGVKAYFAASLGWLATRIDIALVQKMLGSEALGLYAFAQIFVQQALVFPQVVGQILFPRLCQCADWNSRLRLVAKASALIALILAPAFILVGLFGRWAIVHCFGEAYGDVAVALNWLLPGALIFSIDLMLRLMLQSDRFRTSLIFAWLATLLVNLGLNLWLIRIWGIAGAAMAWSLSLAFLDALTISVVILEIRRSRAAVSS
jgi:O-antigen/teichoic acid export membrane protein